MCTYNVDKYAFSSDWVEGNTSLTRAEKNILTGLANSQDQARVNTYPSSNISYKGKVTDNFNGRRTLTKTPVAGSFDANLNDRRWYESLGGFLERKKKEFVKANTKKVKEVCRENLALERSTYEDGTQITTWDKKAKYYL
jgi:hypothetical protein